MQTCGTTRGGRKVRGAGEGDRVCEGVCLPCPSGRNFLIRDDISFSAGDQADANGPEYGLLIGGRHGNVQSG